MFALHKRLVAVVSVGICLVLAGCGGGPSDGDVKKAVRNEVGQQAGVLSGMLGEGTENGQLNSAQQRNLADMPIEVGNKTKQNDGSYDVVVTIEGTTSIMKFVKGSNGWQILDDPGS